MLASASLELAIASLTDGVCTLPTMENTMGKYRVTLRGRKPGSIGTRSEERIYIIQVGNTGTLHIINAAIKHAYLDGLEDIEIIKIDDLNVSPVPNR